MDEDFELDEYVVFSPRTECMERFNSAPEAMAAWKLASHDPPVYVFQVVAVQKEGA